MLTSFSRFSRILSLLWLSLSAGCFLPEVHEKRVEQAAGSGNTKDEAQLAGGSGGAPEPDEAAAGRESSGEAGDTTASAGVEANGGTGGATAMTAAGSGGMAADPCKVDNGGCDTSPKAICDARDGTVANCSCPGGYKGDGRGENGCVDIDECATDNGGCDTEPRATCMNRMGAAPSCKCPTDSTGDGVGSKGCVPVMSMMSTPAPTGCEKYMCTEETANDPVTGLTWQRALPQTYAGCTGMLRSTSVVGDSCTWNEAIAYCSHLTLNSGRWRLPTKAELDSIVVLVPRTDPSIDTVVFPNTPGNELFWSSTTNGDEGCYVNFNGGGSNCFDKGFTELVRCVR